MEAHQVALSRHSRGQKYRKSCNPLDHESGEPDAPFGCCDQRALRHVLHPAQGLQPRAYTNSPVGLHFVDAGYAYSTGKFLTDPSPSNAQYERAKSKPLPNLVGGVPLFSILAGITAVASTLKRCPNFYRKCLAESSVEQ